MKKRKKYLEVEIEKSWKKLQKLKNSLESQNSHSIKT